MSQLRQWILHGPDDDEESMIKFVLGRVLYWRMLVYPLLLVGGFILIFWGLTFVPSEHRILATFVAGIVYRDLLATASPYKSSASENS